ncbi:GDSL esterase/lipase At5g42170-like [Punica granatum]|uniref:GDSL esterase/lipase At5g42170-like n=1 Tax=Punica granatum TaxID=22663 RepID=A0A6P8D074_PUNGR|nr:GDSL esterase/lipase At5g42170-like [Punica granatum]
MSAGNDDIANTYPFRSVRYNISLYSAHFPMGWCEEDRSDEYAAGRIRAGTEDNRWKLEVGVLRASKPSGSALQLFSSSALQLSAKLKDHSAQIPGVRVTNLSGFEVENKGCYGTGNIELSVLCNRLDDLETCKDDTKFLFWDS